MRSLSAPELLGAWERGLTQSLIKRALELLSVVNPQASWDSLMHLSVGQRDTELLALREQLFGPEIAGVAVCPHCGGRLELTLNVSEMQSLGARQPESETTLQITGYELRFRHPNCEDLQMALGCNDADAARQHLLSRCLLSAHRDGIPVECHQLPPGVVNAISEAMAQADPLADIQLAVSCPSCDHRWRASFDVVSFLWSEIENLAARLLRDVHTLASAYGWHETEILALSPVRRQFYLTSLGA